MDDMISRQVAITAIQKAYADTVGGTDRCAVWKNVGLTNALHIMQDLPSVQPEHLVKESGNLVKGLVNDCISRQGVIEVLSQYPFEKVVNCISIIEEFPSAQPEHLVKESGNLVNGLVNDCISRQAAIDALNKMKIYRPLDSDRYVISDCLNKIVNLPSAQPEHTETHSCDYEHTETHGWIPVTEALPEDGVTVWVTIRGHDVIRCEDGETLEQAIARISKIRWVTQGYWSEEEHGWNDPSFGCPLIVQPVAWMPMEMPEPYKEGQE